MVISDRKSFLLGLLILGAGFILFLESLGVLGVDTGYIFSIFWPFLLIIWGGDALLSPGKSKGSTKKKSSVERVIGLIVLAFGILFLSRNLGYHDFDFSFVLNLIWPLILIFLGWNLLRGTRGKEGSSYAILSGLEKREKGWQLKDTGYLAFMGGIDLDLSVAEVKEETHLDLTAVMGGITIEVPSDYSVECSSTTILGGIDFFADEAGGIFSSRTFEHKGAGEKKIFISSRALMGGIEIKRVD